MKTLTITALTILLHAPLSYSMQMGDTDQCTIPIISYAGVCAGGSMLCFQYCVNTALKKKVKKTCAKARTEIEEGEAQDEEMAMEGQDIRRRLSPAQALQMDEQVLALAQLELAPEQDQLYIQAFQCCCAGVTSGCLTLAQCYAKNQ